MVAERESINELRAKLRDAERRAKRKMQRLDREKRVVVKGTEFDPVSKATDPKKLNREQLQRRINKVEKFVSRGTQFVPDANDRPIPINEWREYKRSEREWNRRKRAWLDQYKDIITPSGVTFEASQAIRDTVVPTIGNPSANPMFHPTNRSSTSIASRKKLKQLTSMVRANASDPNLASRKSEEGKYAIRRAAEMMGSDTKNVVEEISKLSDEQFIALWGDRTFADAFFLRYENYKKRYEPDNQESEVMQAMRRSQDETAMSDVKRRVEWAKGVKINDSGKATTKKRKG